MIERQLTTEEIEAVYKEICNSKLEPFEIEYDSDYSEMYYDHKGKQYRLIYDRAGDWFCDIIYEGKYK